MALGSGSHAYFQLVLKRIITSSKRHRPPSKTKYAINLDFIKIKLFDKVVPRTCHNFAQLCTHNEGFGYTGTSIDHVVRGFGLYTGDVVERVYPEQPHDEPHIGLSWSGKVESYMKPRYLAMPNTRLGSCGRSVYGTAMSERVYEDETYFEDENFDIPHDRPGIVTMINAGKPHTNSSRFLMLTAPARHLDGKNVAFGEVSEGLDTLFEIDRMMGSQCGYPTHLIEIVQCGILEQVDDKLPPARTLEELNDREEPDPLAYQKEPVYLE